MGGNLWAQHSQAKELGGGQLDDPQGIQSLTLEKRQSSIRKQADVGRALHSGKGLSFSLKKEEHAEWPSNTKWSALKTSV